MATARQPAWWVLSALLPPMGGLLVLEHQVSLLPAGHKFLQISVVVCIYGLVWLWLRANTLALLRVAYNTYEKTYAAEPNRMGQRLRSHLPPRRAHARKVMLRHHKRHAMAQPYRMEINKCSLN